MTGLAAAAVVTASLLLPGGEQGERRPVEPGVPALAVDEARDLTDEGLVFVEVTAERASYFVHEPVRVVLRCGVEEEFLREEMIQPFARPLDVPVQVQAPWLATLPGALSLHVSPPPAGEATARFVLHDRVAEARRREAVERGGRRFVVLEIEARLFAQDPGPLVLPRPLARFAYATAFADDVFSGRVARDRHDAFVRGEPLLLEIFPLPTEGRPPSFTGAVGTFRVEAEAVPREVSVGESLALVLRFTGEGNLAFLTPPPIEPAGFHVRGATVEGEGASRRLRYEVAPRNARVREVPSLPLAFFDPAPPGRYATAWTRPLAVVVRTPAVPGRDDIFGLKRIRGGGGSAPPRPVAKGWMIAALLLPWLAAGVTVLRRRSRSTPGEAQHGAPGAAERYRTRAAGGEAEAAENLASYLAERLGCTTAAVISPDLAARLEQAGIPGPSAARAAEHLEALVGARFGGADPARAADTARDLVEELERGFRAAEGSR